MNWLLIGKKVINMQKVISIEFTKANQDGKEDAQPDVALIQMDNGVTYRSYNPTEIFNLKSFAGVQEVKF